MKLSGNLAQEFERTCGCIAGKDGGRMSGFFLFIFRFVCILFVSKWRARELVGHGNRQARFNCL